MPASREADAWFPRWLGPALLAVCFGLLARWSWDRWADPSIDFGNDLYVAWRLTSGDALYQDVAVRHGPLSHYLNALWFTLFGTSIRTLVGCNLAILVGICAGLWALFRPVYGRPVTTGVVAVFLCVFAFAQYRGIANFNYVTPYHHYQTHGIALSVAMLLCLRLSVKRAPALGAGLAGACLGLVFLTKAELFIPLLLAAGVGLALLARADPAGAAARLGSFAIGGSLPALLAFVLLASSVPAEVAWRGVLGNWLHLTESPFRDPFYRSLAGFDRPLETFSQALLAAACVLVFAVGSRRLDRVTPAGRRGAAVAAASGVAVFALLTGLSNRIDWHWLAAALPFVALAWLAAAGRRCAREPGLDPARFVLLLFAVLGLGLLTKLGFRADVGHYGFVLAMPVTLLGTAALLAGPVKRAGRGGIGRALGVAVVCAAVLALLSESNDFYRRKHQPVGAGADRMLGPSRFTSPRAALLQQTLSRLEARLGPQSTLLVLPEGAILNYWIRKRNPSPYFLYLPTEMRAFGEPEMIAALAAEPPDYVALLHRLSHEFGVGPFGVDPENGRALLDWVRARYRPVDRIGAAPFSGQGFGVVVLERKPSSRGAALR